MAEKNNEVPAINKMNQIFDLLSTEMKGMSQSSICYRLDLSKATVSRLINTLSGMGYLEQDKNSGLYSLGAKLLALGNIVDKRLDLSVLSAPVIEKLSNTIDEMVKVSIMRGDVVYPVQSCESKKAIRITLDSGTVFPPYIGAAGKLLLAMSREGMKYSRDFLHYIELQSNTEYTITNLIELEKILNQIRTEEFSIDNQEESEGIYAIAVPVFDSNSEVIAAVSIPFFGDFEIKKAKYLPLLKICADEISKSMGSLRRNK
jgi:DNA-binding IclR family transcriptional regulator